MSKTNTNYPFKISVFEFLFLSWSGFVTLSIITAILGFFYSWLSVIYWGLILITLLKLRKNCSVKSVTRGEKIVLLILVTWSLLLSYFTNPTIFGGRDEGSLATLAVVINREHKLTQQNKVINTFANIYGEGKALNFPGFLYQKTRDGYLLKSQFLPGYSAYLANFAQPNEINFLKLANLLPFLIFGLAFFSVLKTLTNSDKHSLGGLIFLISVLPFTIFYKFTLSEFLFASLIWSGLYFLIKYLQSTKTGRQEITRYWFIFIPFIPTFFIRIESFGIVFALILILIFYRHKNFNFPKYQLPIFLVFLSGAISLFLFSHFFLFLTKEFFDFLSSSPDLSNHQPRSFHFIPKMWRNGYILKVFYTYNLIPLFLFAFFGIIKIIKNKRQLKLIPLFLFGVTGIYLLDANISLDHPWMLRRFIFSIIPLAVFYFTIFWQQHPFKQKNISGLIWVVLLLSNTLLTIPFITLQQNTGLTKITPKLAEVFKADDLILVSQKSSGSGWSLLSEPLRTIYQKQAVYFFNPKDYDKIDQDHYNHIYLLTSVSELPHYQEIISSTIPTSQKEIFIENKILKPNHNPWQLPKNIKQETTSLLLQLK